MKITFNNLSGEHIELTAQGKTSVIPALSSTELPEVSESFSFSLNPYEKSYLKYFIRRFGLVRQKSFCLRTVYNAAITRDSVISLRTQRARGSFLDTYHRAVATGYGFPLTLEKSVVADEEEMRKEFASAKKRGNRTVFLFDVLDILKSGLIVALLLLIPFALIWLFGSFETAYTVCGYLFIPIFLVIIIFNRLFDLLRKKLWYFFKGKTLEKSTYKGTDSHFDENYIKEIF